LRKINDPASEVCLPGFEQFQAEFLNTRREEMISLYSALKDLDYVTLEKQCHKWRGFAAPYGFQELALLANDLEEQALSKNTQGCDAVLKRIADYLGNDD
jgi:HPt (histidine-containing phosphotransfer) domain-containing protein